MHAVLLVTVSSDLAQNCSMGLKGAEFVWKVRTEFSVGQVQNLVQSVQQFENLCKSRPSNRELSLSIPSACTL